MFTMTASSWLQCPHTQRPDTQHAIIYPDVHKWHTLHAPNTTPAPARRFNWTDSNFRPPSGASYMHWGRDGLVPEPSNSTGSELCAVANISQAYTGAWGWSDARCNISAPFLCRSLGEWLFWGFLMAGCKGPSVGQPL